MIIKILLFLAIIVQLLVSFTAIGLLKRTRNSFVWWLISIVLLVMVFHLTYNAILLTDHDKIDGTDLISICFGVVESFLMLAGLLLMNKFIKRQNKNDALQIDRESVELSAIVKAEENERSRFAKELHDGLGPLLSSIKMSVSIIKKQIGKDNDLRIIENTEKLIDESIFTIKEISNNISPHILNNFGLIKALQSFINKMQFNNAINIILNSNLEDRRFSYNIEVVFYRVICEMITNTLKHASAKRITIDLFEDKNELLLEYIDDGVGFSPEKAEQSGLGMGLANMRSRINSLNGSFQIKSLKGNGVVFTINVKIA